MGPERPSRRLEMEATMKETILIVDDEEGIRKVLAIALADAGYRVLAAESGEEALELFKQEAPPIVLTDIKMPGIDGVELLRRIKQRNPETEVIMITGHGDMDLAVRSLKYDATDFVTKPINDDILEIALKKAHERIVTRQMLREYTQSLEATLREKMQLQDRLSDLGLRISSISHGIKGLLTGLDGGVYLVESGLSKGDDDQLRDGWRIVADMVERIRTMVLNILFYAKEREFKWERIPVLNFVKEVAAIVESKIREHGFAFALSVDDDPGTVEIDAGHLRSAMVSLLENALDACINASDRTAHRIALSAKSKPDMVAFVVSDTGVGMDAATREKIFDMFYSSKGSKGTGLGLFIAQKVVQQHGGRIEVHSTPGRGTDFLVEIPRTQLQPETAAADNGQE
jgi:signal transduction histidine kinase